MTTTATVSHRNLHFILTSVREYAELLTVYDAFACRGRLPPPTLRVRFKLIEGTLQEPGLPLALARYVHHLHVHPRHPSCRTATSLDRENRCRVCLTAVHAEWRESVARSEVAYLCGRCGAVFTPSIA